MKCGHPSSEHDSVLICMTCEAEADAREEAELERLRAERDAALKRAEEAEAKLAAHEKRKDEHVTQALQLGGDLAKRDAEKEHDGLAAQLTVALEALERFIGAWTSPNPGPPDAWPNLAEDLIRGAKSALAAPPPATVRLLTAARALGAHFADANNGDGVKLRREFNEAFRAELEEMKR